MAESEGPPALPDPTPPLPARRGGAGAGLPERRLTDAEVARVLRLASQADEEAATDAEGVTVPQLAEAAREAGIDPGLVARAAAVTEDPTSTLAATAFGAPDTRTLRASLPGRRIPDERDHLVRALESALHRKGQLHESEPGHLLWKEDHTLGRTTLSLVETGEGIDVVLEADRAGHYLSAWFAGVVGWGLLTALTPLGGLGPAWAVVAFLVVPFLLARPFWIRADRTRQGRLEAAMMGVLGRVDRAKALEAGGGEADEAGEAPPGGGMDGG